MRDQDETRQAAETAPEPMSDDQALSTPPAAADPAGEAGPEGATIGTGTSIALGCVAGTILLIAIGLIYILILALV